MVCVLEDFTGLNFSTEEQHAHCRASRQIRYDDDRNKIWLAQHPLFPGSPTLVYRARGAVVLMPHSPQRRQEYNEEGIGQRFWGEKNPNRSDRQKRDEKAG